MTHTSPDNMRSATGYWLKKFQRTSSAALPCRTAHLAALPPSLPAIRYQTHQRELSHWRSGTLKWLFTFVWKTKHFENYVKTFEFSWWKVSLYLSLTTTLWWLRRLFFPPRGLALRPDRRRVALQLRKTAGDHRLQACVSSTSRQVSHTVKILVQVPFEYCLQSSYKRYCNIHTMVYDTIIIPRPAVTCGDLQGTECSSEKYHVRTALLFDIV